MNAPRSRVLSGLATPSKPTSQTLTTENDRRPRPIGRSAASHNPTVGRCGGCPHPTTMQTMNVLFSIFVVLGAVAGVLGIGLLVIGAVCVAQLDSDRWGGAA